MSRGFERGHIVIGAAVTAELVDRVRGDLEREQHQHRPVPHQRQRSEDEHDPTEHNERRGADPQTLAQHRLFHPPAAACKSRLYARAKPERLGQRSQCKQGALTKILGLVRARVVDAHPKAPTSPAAG